MATMNFDKYIIHAKRSKFGLFKLNVGLSYMIPFNKPHAIKVIELTDDSIKTSIPYKRRNFNHIKGVHACGMATAAEFASGFLLLSKLGSDKYRIIMESLEMKYVYQAKTDIHACYSITEEELRLRVVEPLERNDAILIKCEIQLYDLNKNHVATGYTNWQIKAWNKVRTHL